MWLYSLFILTTHTHTHLPCYCLLSLFFNIIISSLSPPQCDLSSSRPPTSPLTHLPRVPPFRPSSAPPLLTSLGNLLPAVVPVLLGDSQTGSCQPLFGRELPDIPQLDGLVLRVADQVASVTLAPWQNGKKKKETEIWELEQYMWLNKRPVRLMFSFKPFPSNWKTFYWETPPSHPHTHSHPPCCGWRWCRLGGRPAVQQAAVCPPAASVCPTPCTVRHRCQRTAAGTSCRRMPPRSRRPRGHQSDEDGSKRKSQCLLYGACAHVCKNVLFTSGLFTCCCEKCVCVCALMHVCAYAEVMKGAFFFKAAAHWNSDFSVHKPPRLCYKQALHTRHGCESPNAKM